MTEDEAKALKPGDVIDTVVLGRVTVVGHMNGRSRLGGGSRSRPSGSG